MRNSRFLAGQTKAHKAANPKSLGVLAGMLVSLSLLPFAASGQVFRPVTCRNRYTQQQEIDLGRKVVAEVYKTQPVLPDSDPVAQYIRQLGARLAAVAPLTPGLEQPWPYEFHVVASEEINAFALPGGTMFVDLGAIQAAETEAQLAGVMAHELSHVVLRHSTCNLVKQQRRSIWYSLGAIGSSVLLGGAVGDLAAQGVGTVAGLDFLHMSRGDEQQADLLGVQILHDAGFDPRGLSQFFEIIIAKYGRGGAQFLSDHPNPGNRAEYLNREIAQLSPLPNPIKSTPAFTDARAIAAREHALSAAELRTGAWRSSGLYATAPGAGATARAASVAAAPGSDPTMSSPAGASGGTAARLSGDQLGVQAALVLYQGERFAIRRPGSWSVVTPPALAGPGNGGSRLESSVTLAPPGGSGAFGPAYGVVLGWQGEEVAINDRASLGAASDRLAAQLSGTSGLTPEGQVSALIVAGQPATARYLRGASPVSTVGTSGGALERDWLVTVERPDGDLDSLLFVAPAAQWAEIEPLFERMLRTFVPQ